MDMDRFRISTSSAAQTERFGEALGQRLTSGLCAALVGPLGSGKTVLVRGVCRGLGVADDVTSPTFILCEPFEGRLPVVHVDLYRLEREDELEALGLFDMLDGATVLLVEWANRSDAMMASADVLVEISGGDTDTERHIDVSYRPALGAVMKGLERWS